MKNKVVLTILGLFGAVCLLLMIGVGVLVIGGRMYVQQRIKEVDQEVLGLAQQLGYTPDALLVQRKYLRDASPTPLLMATCVNQLYFTTALTIDEFTDQLGKISPATQGQRITRDGDSFDVFDLPVEVQSSDPSTNGALWEGTKKTTYSWYHGRIVDRIHTYFYATSNLPITLIYRGTPIRGNVVQLFKNDVYFPAWFDCK